MRCRLQSDLILTRKPKKCMEYRVLHGVDAIATTTSKLLSCIFPPYSYFEEGCKSISSNKDENCMIVSPDESIRSLEDENPCLLYENKCKSSEAFSKHAYDKIPKYYAVQLLSQMKAYDCQKLLFTCWSEVSLTGFIVEFDEEVWNICWDELLNVYIKLNEDFETKLSVESKNIKSLTQKCFDEKVVEFKSCFAIPPHDTNNSLGVSYLQLLKLADDGKLSKCNADFKITRLFNFF